MKNFGTKSAPVFNCNYNGLSIIQSLGRCGVQVYALDNVRNVGTFSRYAQFWRCPDPLDSEDAFIDFLLEKAKAFTSKPVLFPTNDHWAMAISKHKKLLQRYYIPCVADWETVEILIYKEKFYPWAMNHKYPVPLLYSKDELLNPGSTVYPVVAKPKYRRISNLPQNIQNLPDKLDKNRMVIIKNVDALKNYLAVNEEILPYIIFQEYIPGMADRMYTIGVYANVENIVLGEFTGRKVRGFPPDIGDCMVGQAEKLPAQLSDLVMKIVTELKYQGIAEFEFKRSLKTNEFKLMEINPRSWSWIGITPACGVNLPWIAFADLTWKANISFTQSQVDNGDVKYINLIEDFLNCLHNNKKAGFPEYQMNIGQWMHSLRAKKKVYAGMCWDDPLPMLNTVNRLIFNNLISRLKIH
jgi:predicted ATP-grasp superfamily ATP-dependent carboligase